MIKSILPLLLFATPAEAATMRDSYSAQFLTTENFMVSVLYKEPITYRISDDKMIISTRKSTPTDVPEPTTLLGSLAIGSAMLFKRLRK